MVREVALVRFHLSDQVVLVRLKAPRAVVVASLDSEAADRVRVRHQARLVPEVLEAKDLARAHSQDSAVALVVLEAREPAREFQVCFHRA